MKYDLTLKELFQQLPQELFKILVGQQPKEILAVEYPAVKDRRPDLVSRLEDDTIYHLELQSDNDKEMPWRMLEYYSLIKRQYRQPIIQQVLYVGSGKMKMSDHIIENDECLRFKYHLIDIRKIDCAALLKSSALEDNLLAVLCRVEKHQETIQVVLQRIAQLNDNARRDALEKLQILMGLRGVKLRQVFNQEVDKMPITVDVRNTAWYQDGKREGILEGERRGILEGERKGKLEGEAVILQRLLTKRFGSLPDWAVEKIRHASSEQLELWSLRLLEADTLEEAFAQVV